MRTTVYNLWQALSNVSIYLSRFAGGFGSRDYRQQNKFAGGQQNKFGGGGSAGGNPGFGNAMNPQQYFYGGGYGGSYGGTNYNQPQQQNSTDWWGN